MSKYLVIADYTLIDGHSLATEVNVHEAKSLAALKHQVPVDYPAGTVLTVHTISSGTTERTWSLQTVKTVRAVDLTEAVDVTSTPEEE